MKLVALSFSLLILATATENRQLGAQTAAGSGDISLSASKKLEATVHRYLESSKSYQRGDLVTQIQLAELQSYLRKTSGHSPATHPRLLKRALPDRAPLVRYFYVGGHKRFLRRVAEKAGGYAKLDFLSRSAAGRTKIDRALQVGNEESFLELLGNVIPKASAKQVQPIYTANDFLAAVRNSSKTTQTGSVDKENDQPAG